MPFFRIFDPMINKEDFLLDDIYGERLLISKKADQTELDENIRVARVLLSCFDDMNIRINEHLLVFGHKNPEYTINERLGDRKGLESENGIKSAFRKAKEQGCQTVVIDFDMHLAGSTLKTKKIASGIYGRHDDFESGSINMSLTEKIENLWQTGVCLKKIMFRWLRRRYSRSEKLK